MAKPYHAHTTKPAPCQGVRAHTPEPVANQVANQAQSAAQPGYCSCTTLSNILQLPHVLHSLHICWRLLLLEPLLLQGAGRADFCRLADHPLLLCLLLCLRQWRIAPQLLDLFTLLAPLHNCYSLLHHLHACTQDVCSTACPDTSNKPQNRQPTRRIACVMAGKSTLYVHELHEGRVVPLLACMRSLHLLLLMRVLTQLLLARFLHDLL